ncbi:unnamed protein product [Ambrosiozyma monospora]|uniref:Unnamed protein product n=1 Tax=Ambrosiozyma monospora TaxID=43982 RepID=A0A9W6T4R1_AMBMO|nr:unnamed protein product [Ambrosiozyma monospora]
MLFTKFIDETSPHGSGLYMSLGHEIHRLLLDSYNGYVNVKVYTRNTKSDDDVLPVAENKDYVEYIRTRYAVEYHPVTVKGSLSEARNRYNWNRLDQMMAGYDENDEDKKMHRLKFVILPTKVHENSYGLRSETLTEEEIRLEGIRSIVNLINNDRFRTDEEKKSRPRSEIIPEINFYTGNLFSFLNTASNEFLSENKHVGLFTEATLDKNISFPKLALAIQGEKGIEIKNRTWHSITYKNCFVR